MCKQFDGTEITKNKFIDVFCELYKENPIEKITVQEIARRSGYNRSTFYQYFSDIYELLEYVENDVLSYAQNAPFEDILPSGTVSESMIYHVAKLFDDKGHYLSALVGTYGSVRFIDKFKSTMLKTLNSKSNFPVDNVYVPYVQEFYVSTMISMFSFWNKNNKTLSSEELISLISEIFTNGVIPIMRQLTLESESTNETD